MNPWSGRFWGLAGLAAIFAMLTGCASVTQGTEQSIKVETLTATGQSIDGAQCQWSNDKGSATMASGQSALVRRSGANLSLRCDMAGQATAKGQAISRANAGLAGNILIGGGIGAAIDVGTGAAYTYPTWIQLVFGEERLYDRGEHRDDSAATGTLVRPLAPVAVASAGPPSAAVPAAVAAATPTVPASPAVSAIPVAPTVQPPGPPPARQASSLSAPLRRGDTLEYVLIDRLTQTRAPVLYRVDRIDGDRILFNQGGRVEREDGRVLSISSAAGGLYDSASPPEGWGRPGLTNGMRWRVEYESTNGEKARYALDAMALGDASLRIDGLDVAAREITYTGWMYASVGVGPAQALPFKATVFYSAELGRVVKFEAEYRRVNLGASREALELVRIWR